jgi:hypothetical protein
MDRDLKRAKMLISLVYDGRLSEEENRFLERAIGRYPELKLEVYRHERLHDLVGIVPAAAAPPDIEARVLEAIRSDQPLTGRIIPFPRWRFPVQVAGAVAAAVVVVLAALISYPFLTGTNDKVTVLLHDTFGTSTASVAMGEAPADVSGNARPPAEDVALVPAAGENKPDDRLPSAAMDDTTASSPAIGRNTFSSEVSPAGVMTSAGITAEKVSKILVPPREAPVSIAKKEVPMSTTTFISSPSDTSLPPTVLLIYHNDPTKAQKDIIDKAVSLGGTVTKMETDEFTGKDKAKTEADAEGTEEQDRGEMISLPPEKFGELLDYLASRYAGIDKNVSDIKANEITRVIRIDVVPTIQ